MNDKILNAFFSEKYALCLQLCESFQPGDPDREFSLEFAALSCVKLGQWQKALEYLKAIYVYKKTSFWALNLAKAYALNMNFDEAFKLFNRLLKEEILWDEAALECAFASKAAGEIARADMLFQKLLKKHPFNLELWTSYAELYFDINAQKSLELHERLCEVARNLIVELNKNHQFNHQILVHKLETRLQRADENPQIDEIKDYLNTKIYPQIAYLYLKLFRIQESLDLFASLQEYNQHNAPFWQNYAKVLEFSSNYQAAIAAYEKSISLHSHATYYFDLAYLLMRIGNFDEGIRHYEARLYYAYEETFSSRHYKQSLDAFNKEGVNAFKDKVVVVFCEQGFGDTLMYARCLEKLCQIAKKVLFAPQSLLYKLFQTSLEKFNDKEETFANMEILEDIPTEFDYAVPICSLPLFCSIPQDEISKLKTPIYIERTQKQNKIKKIGLFWFTPKGDDHNNPRNFELGFLIKALKGVPYELISFQMEGTWNLPQNIHNKAKDLQDWFDTYKALKELDLLISIDTAIAHLALAMDIPTIVLLHQRFDWRWGRFEAPASFFWTKANIFVCKDTQKSMKELRAKVDELLA